MESKLILLLWFTVAHAFQINIFMNVQHDDEWEMFKANYGRTYTKPEEYARRLIWEQNVNYIQKHNLQYDLGKYSYFLGINEFTDMTNEEFKLKYLGLKKPEKLNNSIDFMTPLNIGQLPDTVDWVAQGYVTPVKNQLQCGSCWSFSTTGSLEGQYFRKTKNLISFSEQQLVDCSGAYGNYGCNGGLMDNAFRYLKNFGIEKEQDYPYTATTGSCRYNVANVVTKVLGIVDIKEGNEKDLAAAVATQGPISVAIDAKHKSFQLYAGGIYNELSCSTTLLDHGVLVVGYGIENGQKYWLVKNSWGPKWGANGFIKMKKDKNNQCGIATLASYPLL